MFKPKGDNRQSVVPEAESGKSLTEAEGGLTRHASPIR